MNTHKQNTSLHQFETYLHEKGFLADTIRAYCVDVRQYLDWLSERGKESPQAASVDDAQAYVTFLAEPLHVLRPGKIGPYSASTIVRKVKILRYFYDFLDITA